MSRRFTTKEISQSLFIAAVTAVAGVAAGDDRVYQGGPWNDGNSWSPFGVPQPFDRAIMPASQTGLVSIGGGFNVDSILFEFGSAGYNLNSDAVGRALRITNEGSDTNQLSIQQLTGREYFGQDVLVIDGTPLIVNSTIVNNPDGGGTAPLDLYLGANLVAPAHNTGITRFVSFSEIDGLGAITSSQNISVDLCTLHLRESSPGFITRLNDSADLNLSRGNVWLHGDGTEFVQSINIRSGTSVINTTGQGAFATAGDQSITRDTTERGTLLVNPEEDFFIYLTGGPSGRIGNFVPWAVVRDNLGRAVPAIYDPGNDEAFGTIDDTGFAPSTPGPFNTGALLPEEDGLIEFLQHRTLADFSQTDLRSMTIDALTSLHVGGGAILTLHGGVIAMGPGATLSGGIANTVQIPPGREAIVHLPEFGGTSEISARISGGNGLTIGGGGNLILSGGNNLSGPVTMNSGKLTVRHPSALSADGPIRLNEAGLAFEFPVAAIPQRVIFNSGNGTPVTSGGFTLDFAIPDGQTVTASGPWEGTGTYFLLGNGSKIIYTATGAPTSGVQGQMVFFVTQDLTLEMNGKLGDLGLGTRGTVLLDNGLFCGNGEISGGFQLSNSGVFAPGTNNGANIALMKTADLGMFGGEARFQVNGTNRGVTYDALDVADYAFFAGGGSINITGSLSGSIGTRLELVRGPVMFGTLPTVNIGLGLTQANTRWVKILDGDSFDIAVAGPNGDATLDGMVNLDDFTALAAAFGSGGQWISGDFNGDNVVNLDDFTILAASFGQSTADLPRGASVPEPGAMLVSTLLFPALLARRRRA